MATAGKIYTTSVEISEDGTIWLIQNHFESDSVITEMESSAHGRCIIDDASDWFLEDDPDDDFL